MQTVVKAGFRKDVGYKECRTLAKSLRKEADFKEATKRVLARRVGEICSFPGCSATTSGPHSDPAKATSVGKAAHITAAAPGGPRYDSSLTEVQRRSAENGIWLCGKHHDLIDNDECKYTADEIRALKTRISIQRA